MAEPPRAASGARLTIDLDALAHNYRVLSATAEGAEVAPVVKADAYGLGVGPVARRLWALGARSFFVARLAEGEALRSLLTPGRPSDIYVLDGLTEGAGPRLAAAGLIPVLCSLAQVTAAAGQDGSGGDTPVALNIDTGMNRQGLAPQEASALAASSDGLRGLQVRLVMSHLGSAFEPENPRNAKQLADFLKVRKLFPEARASLAASPGLFLGPQYRFDLVRPGVSLFGGGPLETPDERLRAVVTLSAPILDIRQVCAGEAVGYGESVRMSAPARVAVVAAGYADGVLRAAQNGGYAWFAGARRKLLIVNMDLLIIELNDAAASVGDEVELLGPNVQLNHLSAAADTVAHEVLVRLSHRAERVYVGEA